MTPRRFYLRRVRLNAGGYASDGRYWGTGKPLYYYESADGDDYGHIRAYNREDAEDQVRAGYDGATFYR